jgi:hypothetical protein
VLVQTLARNVYAEAAGIDVAARGLAAYVRQMTDDLDVQEIDDLLRGIVNFPEPAALAPAAE